MVNDTDVSAGRTIASAPKNQRVLIEGINHLGADEMAMAWLDRIDSRWYYAPQGGLVQWSPTHWQPIPASVRDNGPTPEAAAKTEQIGKGPYTWPAKACPCGSCQREECLDDGCKWQCDPSLVPESLRIYRADQAGYNCPPVDAINKDKCNG